MGSVQVKSELVQYCKKVLTELANLIWMPGHFGVKVNEKSDTSD